MKNNVKKVCALLLTAVICITLLSFSAFSVSLDTKGSVTLHVADFITEEPISDMTFKLYFFAHAYEKANGVGYDYVIPYDYCDMELDNLEDSYLGVHLAHYANTHSLPYSQGTTDANGNAVFTGLQAGLYLAVYSKSGNEYYVPSPFVVFVPEFDKENRSWKFDVVAKPKMLSYTWVDTSGDTYISVEKVWETDGPIPDSVTVSLLKDYVEVERVVLNEGNNWKHRWTKLSKLHSWSVVETRVPDGFSVSYKISENTVEIINTSDSEEPPETTVPSDEEDTTKPDTSSPQDTTRPDDDKETTKPDKLEQTGQLNWPVPVFSIAGMLIFSMGWLLFNSGKKDEEEDGEAV